MSLDHAQFRSKYSAFLGAHGDRVLLTGHSHQAWPDVARDALTQCFDDAARFVDDKWEHAVFPRVTSVGERVLTRMGFESTDAIAFGKSTHELVSRLFSCFRADKRPRIVTTKSEFHSLYRQLTRLEEEGFEVVWVDTTPRAELADRLLEAITPGTSVVAFSAVLYEDAFIVPRLGEILARAVEVGAVPLVDAYHAFNVAPLAWGPAKDHVYVTAGGYKYAQFGEGICWLRIPRDSALRPVDTGWFADFASLGSPRTRDVRYGGGGARFNGATFDPTAFYRADAVLEHFDAFDLDLTALRTVSTIQTRRIRDGLVARGLSALIASSDDDARRAGFVAVRHARAGDAVTRLRDLGVFTDARHDLLRLGPAPYLTDSEIDRGVDATARVLSEL
jgi:selenocysteine lyase/cysteine desulfurase